MDLDGPFRGSAAVAAGLLTRDRLYGSRFRRVFPDVYVPATTVLDLKVRSRAAAVYVGGRGVLVGYSAAELLGASCTRTDAPAEVTAPDGHRCPPGLVVHRFRPAPDEVANCDGIPVTTALRTAYDLGRRPDRTEAVVAVDALARGRFGLDELRELAVVHRGERGLVRLRAALALADPRSGPYQVAVRVHRELVARGAASPTPVGPPLW